MISVRTPPRRLNSMGCLPTKMRLLASTVMTSRSSSLRIAFALACGRFTSTPWVSMGAVTMKMMRRTSMTSTSGVTLISAMTLRSPARPEELIIAMMSPLVDLALEEVDEFGGEAVDPGVDRPDAGQEVVVGDDGRDGRGQPRRGRNEGFGDAGGHGGQRRVPRRRDAGEGVHDPPHGAEQADERRRAAGGGEKGKEILHAPHLFMGRPGHRAVYVLDGKGSRPSSLRGLAACRFAPLALDPGQLEVSRADHLGEGRLHPLFGLLVERRKAFPLGEGAGEFRLVPLDPLEEAGLEKNNRPGDDGEQDQEEQDELDDGPRKHDVLQHLGIENPRRQRDDGHHQFYGNDQGFLLGSICGNNSI